MTDQLRDLAGLDSRSRWPRTPAAKFSALLALALSVGMTLATLTTSALVQRMNENATIQTTRAALETHFGSVLNRSVFGAALTDEERTRFDRAVRLHFGLYHIVDTYLVRPDGTVAYSYHPRATGQPAHRFVSAQHLSQALAGTAASHAVQLNGAGGAAGQQRRGLAVYTPIRSGGTLAGAAVVFQDIEELAQELLLIKAAIAGASLLVAAGLFFSLRRVYWSSTQRILAQEQALRNVLEQIEISYDVTLLALSAALDTRDAETEGHSRRVAAYTAVLAAAMGISGQELVDVTRGALLHDVGKIGVPDSILLKPAKLTPEEWVEMRKHPEMGYNMLRDIEFLRGSLPIVLHHQERYDGSGYPNGLAGEAIPLGARIFAVADAFDAMTSDRPYRQAMPYRHAAEELMRYRGRQFDPAVVDTFLSLPEQIWWDVRRGTEAGAIGIRKIIRFAVTCIRAQREAASAQPPDGAK